MQNKVIGIMKIINLFEYVIVFCLAMYSFFYTYSLWDIKRDKTNQQDFLLFIIIFIIYYLIFSGGKAKKKSIISIFSKKTCLSWGMSFN